METPAKAHQEKTNVFNGAPIYFQEKRQVVAVFFDTTTLAPCALATFENKKSRGTALAKGNHEAPT